MTCVILDENVCTLDTIKNLAENVGYNVLAYTNPFDFFSHFDHTNIYTYLFLISDEALRALDENIDNLIRHYDLRTPIFAYNLNNYAIQLSMNNLDFYRFEYSKEYISHLLKIKELFVKMAKDSKIFLGNYTFKENVVMFHYDMPKPHRNSILGNDASSNPYNETNILSHFTKTQQKIFQYLCLNKNGVNIKEIVTYMWGEDSFDKRANVYTIICNLKKILEHHSEYNYELHHSNKKYKLVRTTNQNI